jgi:hypothetical protein
MSGRGEAMQAHDFIAAEREARRRNAFKLEPGHPGPRWTGEQLALLGTRPDGEVAALIGRAATAGAARYQLGGAAVALPGGVASGLPDCRGSPAA